MRFSDRSLKAKRIRVEDLILLVEKGGSPSL